jgi:outer membrane cobalamin receptor
MTRAAGHLLFLVILAACGTTGGATRGSSDVLTRAEIAQSGAANAYELLQQLRPQFLRSRGTLSVRNPAASQPVVYMNEVRHGGIQTLRSILIEEIAEIRYISAPDATTRWGTGHAGGVIQVLAHF